MQPHPGNLLRRIDLSIPPVGFYDAPDPSAFAPLVEPVSGKRACTFSFWQNWLNGETLHITRDNYGCPGAGYWLCRVETMSRQDFVKFLVDGEGLRASHDLMNQWFDQLGGYKQQHAHLLIGPLQEQQYEYLRTVTFYVNPDQLSILMHGAQYNHRPGAPLPVLAPMGSGCGQLAAVFDDMRIPQSVIGTTDIAMRQHLPSDILAFTVTRSMFEQLCELDERSFLYKSFWQNLRKVRGLPDL